ncbi:betaine/proline/choline family ABC transporter ATP-binding protein [Mumia zhuanghuii]|nr:MULTISPECIES: betaine/proline/choline family ABC transporter ATP-binding protein [Mumia]KAA1418085.1 betaine/proline/choline family ABC transporter ATP-binding protein [Mumia zhuanghuii]KAA1425431.1 betaine/proline/choline family ABC transporter ATP-binding protein [Mumia zhuanghuii]
MIVLDGVGKQYADGSVAVRDLSLSVPRGSLVALVGPSGCGKSTTLKMINRLIEPTSGRILIDGEDVTRADPVELRRGIGYVIQQVGLFPHQSIRENVTTVPTLLGWSRKRARARADELLEMVGLDPATYADRYPHQLSGGQRQRVGVARALAADPPVLLMDEPFGAVDPIVRERLQDEFLRLQHDLAKTVVFVTHDIDEAVRLGDRVAVLASGGDLRQYDSPAAVLGSPADEFVAEFVGADRGLRRLAVTPIEVGDLEEAPVVRRGASAGDVRQVAAGSDVPWAIVVDDDDRLAGWAPAEQPAGSDAMRVRPMEATVHRSATLKEAWAVMLRYDAGWVAVLDDDRRLLGVLTPESLHAALRRSVRITEPA